MAAKRGNIDVVKVLLEFGGTCIDVNAGHALSLAAGSGHIDIVRVLLSTRGTDVNAGNALYLAIGNNHLQVVDLLMAGGSERNLGETKDNINNNVEICGKEIRIEPAVEEEHADELNILFNSLIDPNQKYKVGSAAASHGAHSIACVSTALGQRQDCECGIETPLSIAQRRGHKEVVQRLLQHPEINQKWTYNNKFPKTQSKSFYEPKQNINLSCTTTNDCGPGQYCYEGGGIDEGDPNKCKDLPDKCSFNGDKDSDSYVPCPDGYTCNYEHKCEPLPGTINCAELRSFRRGCMALRSREDNV